MSTFPAEIQDVRGAKYVGDWELVTSSYNLLTDSERTQVIELLNILWESDQPEENFALIFSRPALITFARDRGGYIRGTGSVMLLDPRGNYPQMPIEQLLACVEYVSMFVHPDFRNKRLSSMLGSLRMEEVTPLLLAATMLQHSGKPDSLVVNTTNPRPAEIPVLTNTHILAALMHPQYATCRAEFENMIHLGNFTRWMSAVNSPLICYTPSNAFMFANVSAGAQRREPIGTVHVFYSESAIRNGQKFSRDDVIELSGRPLDQLWAVAEQFVQATATQGGGVELIRQTIPMGDETFTNTTTPLIDAEKLAGYAWAADVKVEEVHDMEAWVNNNVAADATREQREKAGFDQSQKIKAAATKLTAVRSLPRDTQLGSWTMNIGDPLRTAIAALEAEKFTGVLDYPTLCQYAGIN